MHSISGWIQRFIVQMNMFDLMQTCRCPSIPSYSPFSPSSSPFVPCFIFQDYTVFLDLYHVHHSKHNRERCYPEFSKKPLVISQKLRNIHRISQVDCIAMCPIFCWIGIIGIHKTLCAFFWLTGIISYKFYKVMVWELSWSMWKVGTFGICWDCYIFFRDWDAGMQRS